jgi:4-hydroxy-tetrahydrodipicolinate synthase
MVVQDYPLSFAVQMSPGVIRRMVQALPSVVMLKHEDWPGLDKISALRAFEAEGSMRRLAILCGNGGLFFDQELGRGADGANTGYAFAEMLCDMVQLWRAGQADAMHDLFDAHLPLLRYEQQPGVGLAVRKYVLMRRGLLAHDTQRQPGAVLPPAARAEVEHLLKRLARRDARAQLPNL